MHLLARVCHSFADASILQVAFQSRGLPDALLKLEAFSQQHRALLFQGLQLLFPAAGMKIFGTLSVSIVNLLIICSAIHNY